MSESSRLQLQDIRPGDVIRFDDSPKYDILVTTRPHAHPDFTGYLQVRGRFLSPHSGMPMKVSPPVSGKLDEEFNVVYRAKYTPSASPGDDSAEPDSGQLAVAVAVSA